MLGITVQELLDIKRTLEDAFDELAECESNCKEFVPSTGAIESLPYSMSIVNGILDKKVERDMEAFERELDES